MDRFGHGVEKQLLGDMRGEYSVPAAGGGHHRRFHRRLQAADGRIHRRAERAGKFLPRSRRDHFARSQQALQASGVEPQTVQPAGECGRRVAAPAGPAHGSQQRRRRIAGGAQQEVELGVGQCQGIGGADHGLTAGTSLALLQAVEMARLKIGPLGELRPRQPRARPHLGQQFAELHCVVHLHLLINARFAPAGELVSL